MPKIQINERDLSWYYRQREPGQLVVLMPGISSWGPVFSSGNNRYPVLINEENFNMILGDKPVNASEDFSYHMALSYIKAGIDVYFLRIDPGFVDDDIAKVTTASPSPVAGVFTLEITTKATAGDKLIVNGVEIVAGSSDWSLTTDTPEGNATEVAAFLSGSDDQSISMYTWTSNGAVVTATEKSGYEGLKNIPTFSVENTTNGTLAIETTSTPGTPQQMNLEFKAKYPGSFGGRLSVYTYGTGNIRNVRVYLDRKTLVEDVVCDFSDVYSPYYYEVVNRSTSYIEVRVRDGSYNPSGVNVEDLKLTFSTNNTDETMYLHDEVFDSSGNFDRNKVVSALKNSLYDTANNHYTDLFLDLKDPLIYNFGIVVDGGYNDCSDDSAAISYIDRYFTDLVKGRMDAVYLVSGASGMSPELFFTYCGLPSDSPSYNDPTFDTSFVAAFGPWCYARLLSNGAIRELPGYYPFLVAWGQSMSNGNPIWLAPAGVKRASLGDIVKDTKYFVGSSVIDMWQNQEFVVNNRGSSWKVNPICKLKQYGFVVYGNSTLLKNFHNGAMSMLQSFSTRVMVNLIKTRAFDISLTLQFDQTSRQLFGEFKTLMGTFLDQLRRSEALYDYKIIADFNEMTLDDLNSHTVPIKIMISPTPTAENFVINLEISKAGITFSDETPDALAPIVE